MCVLWIRTCVLCIRTCVRTVVPCVRTYLRTCLYTFFFKNEGQKYNVCSLASILLYNIIVVDKRVSVSFASLCNFVQQVPASSKLQCQVQNSISYSNLVCISVFIFDFRTPVSCYQRMTVARRTNGQYMWFAYSPLLPSRFARTGETQAEVKVILLYAYRTHKK